MKRLFVILAASAVATTVVAAAPPQIVELPLTMHEGYGGMKIVMGGFGPDTTDPTSEWFKSRVQIQRLPENLTQVQAGAIVTNFCQSHYQNFLAGNITPNLYSRLQKGNLWIPDTLALSKTPVRTKIAFVFGINADGVKKFVLDANGNLDLSDDAQFVPITMDSAYDNADKELLLQTHGVQARVETFTHGEIVEQDVPVFVAYMPRFDMYFANIGRHATAQYEGQTLFVNSSGFVDLSFNDPIVKLGDDYYKKGEYLTIGGEVLKIVGVNTNNSTLLLERAESSQLHSTQTGYAAHPFNGDDFATRTPISLESLRGKYVYLDFWAVWCGACIQEFPHLRALYDKTSRTQFEILGIVGRSEASELTSSIEKHGIVWPQILSDEICKLYGVHGYPTTLLIDPNGVVVAKNLRGAELEEEVLKLLGE